MQATVEQWKREVEAIVERSGVGDRLLSVAIDPNDDPEHPFVRIYLKLRAISKLPVDDLIALETSIEDRLSEIDDRSASVRFPDAD